MKLDEFRTANEPIEGGDTFQLGNSKLLDIDLDGAVMARAGSMIAYSGEISFAGKASAEGGITGFLKNAATGEGTPVMEASGDGHLYLADQGKRVQIIELDADEELSVNGNDVLAFESRVDYEIRTIDSIAASSTGGLTNVFLSGPGTVAITTHGDPLVLTPPVRTDPDATVAWSGATSPTGSVNRSLSDLVGQSSEETYQLEFTDPEGFVIVQPFEEGYPQQ
ncbi:hypothetical protein HAPAU_28750 [Halalkalicoccus paucihalophilus]|uniref:Mitochondrial biogenesis AIM24 n=1 Tax=Halalkalicoccus paucihalophilus TaxID=1008153 RepID=A0A151ABT5_9EURY|nr:AIM24 family protein [Halalkalicoccus paucihalophilus]KYH25054.1 hypothetical protein HAPAU_28750 [Halalkalicoccus paucihalophilus]